MLQILYKITQRLVVMWRGYTSIQITIHNLYFNQAVILALVLINFKTVKAFNKTILLFSKIVCVS